MRDAAHAQQEKAVNSLPRTLQHILLINTQRTVRSRQHSAEAFTVRLRQHSEHRQGI